MTPTRKRLGLVAVLAGLVALAVAQLAAADPVYTRVPGPQIYAEATSAAGAHVSFAFPNAESNTTHTALPVECDHFGGQLFPIGLTHVVCYATDAGTRVGASFEVIVRHTSAPALTVPADLTLEANGSGGRIVAYSATAYDLVDGGRPVTCTKPSHSVFPVGTTTVACSSADTAGNSGSQGFKVTITDTTAPAFGGAPADQIVEATSSAGATATYAAPTATDLVSGTLKSVCTPASGSTFALGATKVSCTATDAAGNASSVPFTVTVRDTTAPAITVPANKTVKAKSSKGVKVTYTATAVDTVDGSVMVTCKPASGKVFKVGTTTVTCKATDAAGNQASKSFKVKVTR